VTASQRLRQGYLVNSDTVSIRVRIIDGSDATLTIKTARAGVSREEFEYPVLVEHAERLLQLCAGVIIAKVRHIVPAGDLAWEIDAFEGENEGLVIAEIELEHPEQAFERPDWLGEEVTHDHRFYNAALSRRPYSRW
jgi:adenylate cyclase